MVSIKDLNCWSNLWRFFNPLTIQEGGVIPAICQPAVNFSFHQVHMKQKASNYQVSTRFTIKQADLLSYGNRRANHNFWKNLRLVIPYSMLIIYII